MLDGKQWLFGNSLFVLQELDDFSQLAKLKFDHETFWIQLHELPIRCMIGFYDKFIGDSIGKVKDVDVEADNMCWNYALRVRVEINLTKLLARGQSITVQEDKLWIPI